MVSVEKVEFLASQSGVPFGNIRDGLSDGEVEKWVAIAPIKPSLVHYLTPAAIGLIAFFSDNVGKVLYGALTVGVGVYCVDLHRKHSRFKSEFRVAVQDGLGGFSPVEVLPPEL